MDATHSCQEKTDQRSIHVGLWGYCLLEPGEECGVCGEAYFSAFARVVGNDIMTWAKTYEREVIANLSTCFSYCQFT
jgi:hypothetical protein